MRTHLLTLSLLTFCLSATAQAPSFKSAIISVEKAGTVNLSAIPDDFSPSLQNLEMPKPGSNSTRAQLMRTKEALRLKYPLKRSVSKIDSAGADMPALLRNREGNLAGTSIPNDNDMAISNAGKVVSVINTNIFIYDAVSDTQLLSKSLSTFAMPLALAGSKYDPKVCYDPGADRFIMVYLNGTTWQTTKIIVAFSQTHDPSGTWNLYALNGNPLNDSTWSDYPVIGISNEDLYIGINTFTNGSSNNSGFTQSCFWQIDKEAGYSGSVPLPTKYYYDILTGTKPIFNITPIKGGKEPYGPSFYLLSNRNTAAENDSIFVLKVTGEVNDPSTTLQVTTLISDVKYILPPAARQPSGQTFDTNDSRILGGFFQDNVIQFVQSTLDTATGHAGIYHGFIRNVRGNMSATANIIADTLLDMGFPNISYTGTDSGETEAIINFNHTAPTVFSGFSSIYYSNDNKYSPVITIKEGSSVVNLMTGTYERWGDYSGSQTKYNEPTKVWAVGSYGKSNGRHGTWIAELQTPDSVSSVTEPPPAPSPTLSRVGAYPNPAEDEIKIAFKTDTEQVLRFALYDMRGRRVTMLMEERVKEGDNLFTFHAHPLTSGMYVLSIETQDGKVLQTEKIIKK